MRKVIGLFILAICLASPGLARSLSLPETIDSLRQALRQKDMATLQSHIALESIVRSKLKRYALKAKRKESLTAKVAGQALAMSEGKLAQLATSYILSEFRHSSGGLRQSYLSSLKIDRIMERGNYGVAVGSFMGGQVIISCLKIENKWIVVGVDSPLIDREFRNLLKIMRVPT